MGYLLVATMEKGICSVKMGDTKSELETILFQDFHQAELVFDCETHQDWVTNILSLIDGNQPHIDLPLDIHETSCKNILWYDDGLFRF